MCAPPFGKMQKLEVSRSLSPRGLVPDLCGGSSGVANGGLDLSPDVLAGSARAPVAHDLFPNGGRKADEDGRLVPKGGRWIGCC